MAYLPSTAAADTALATIMAALNSVATADRLLALRSLAVLIGARRAATVLTARSEDMSWQEIGDRLGMSRQSVWQRYSHEAAGHDEPTAVAGADRGFSTCAAYKAFTVPGGGRHI